MNLICATFTKIIFTFFTILNLIDRVASAALKWFVFIKVIEDIMQSLIYIIPLFWNKGLVTIRALSALVYFLSAGMTEKQLAASEH